MKSVEEKARLHVHTQKEGGDKRSKRLALSGLGSPVGGSRAQRGTLRPVALCWLFEVAGIFGRRLLTLERDGRGTSGKTLQAAGLLFRRGHVAKEETGLVD